MNYKLYYTGIKTEQKVKTLVAAAMMNGDEIDRG